MSLLTSQEHFNTPGDPDEIKNSKLYLFTLFVLFVKVYLQNEDNCQLCD